MLEPKKVLILSLAYFPKFVGGAEIAIKEITDRLPGHLYSFDMVTMRFNSDLSIQDRIGSINIFRVGMSSRSATMSHLPFIVRIAKLWAPISIFLQARKLHKKNNYDLVWVMMANQAGFAGLFFKKIYKDIPLLLSIQEGDSPKLIKKKVGILYPLYKQIFRTADKIQTISHFLADFSKTMSPNTSISVVPNGVDIRLFSAPAMEIKKNTRAELDIGTENQILITASRLVEKNGIEDLIRALTFLPDTIKLLILGDGVLRTKLQQLTADLNLAHRVIFKGFVSPHELPKYFSIADIFARPSISEGLGNVFLEAMAARIPVIATPVGGIPDIVKDGITGLLVNVGDPKDIATKVNLILKDSIMRNNLINNGYNMVLEKYDWSVVAKQMDEIFNSVKVSI